jgi:hypothetical protein
MTEKEKMWYSFLAGFTAARTRGTPNVELGPVSQQTAKQIFNGWHEKNYEGNTGMGCPTCPAGPEHIHEGSEETVCQSCGCVLIEQ